MGGDQRGKAGFFDDVQQFGEYDVGSFGVEVAGRLVGQQQLRGVGQRPGNGHPLLFAAGHFRRPVFQTAAEVQPFQQPCRSFSGGFCLAAGNQLRQHHVFFGAEVRQQVVILVNKTEKIAAEQGAQSVAELGTVLPVEINFAAAGRFEQSGNLQQG